MANYEIVRFYNPHYGKHAIAGFCQTCQDEIFVEEEKEEDE